MWRQYNAPFEKIWAERQFLLHLKFIITQLIVWETLKPHHQTIKLQCVYYILGKISEVASFIRLCGFISKVLIFLSLGGERNSNSGFFLEFWGRWEVLWNHQCCSLEPNPSNWCHWLRFTIFFWTKFGDFFVALLNISARRRCCSHSCHFTRDHWDDRRKNNQLLN